MSVPLDRLPERETVALRDLVTVANSLGTPLLLIGAIARQLVFDEPYGLPTRRTTRDLDFGVRVPDWATFQRLRNEASDSKRFAPGTRIHTLIHLPTNLPIDLVPFGGLEIHGVIRWPNEDTEMMVAGFDDAFEHAVAAEIAPGLCIRVVTVPLLAALKLFAFADRGSAFKKDIDDLLFIMEHYSAVTGVGRLYDSPLDALVASADFDVQYAGALLLGFDMARSCQADTRRKLLPIVDSLTDSNAAWLHPFVRSSDEDEEKRGRRSIADRFAWLARGLRSPPIK